MKNIVLIGMPGCGKTTIGKRLARRLDREFIDMDCSIEEDVGMSVSDIFEMQGEEAFRRLETEKAQELSSMSGIIISTGGGAVTRDENMRCLKENGMVFFIERRIDKIVDTSDMSVRPLLQEDGANTLKKLYDKRIDIYRKFADYIVTNNGEQYVAVEKIMKVAQGNV